MPQVEQPVKIQRHPFSPRAVAKLVVGSVVAILAFLVVWFALVPVLTPLPAMFVKADKLVDERKIGEARTLLETRLRHTVLPQDRMRLYLGLARIYQRVGSYNQALPHALRAESIDRNNVSVIIALGDIYVAQGKNAQAAEYYQRVADHYRKAYAGKADNVNNEAPYYEARVKALIK